MNCFRRDDTHVLGQSLNSRIEDPRQGDRRGPVLRADRTQWARRTRLLGQNRVQLPPNAVTNSFADLLPIDLIWAIAGGCWQPFWVRAARTRSYRDRGHGSECRREGRSCPREWWWCR